MFPVLLLVAGIFAFQFGTIGVTTGIAAIFAGIGSKIWGLRLAKAAEAEREADPELTDGTATR